MGSIAQDAPRLALGAKLVTLAGIACLACSQTPSESAGLVVFPADGGLGPIEPPQDASSDHVLDAAEGDAAALPEVGAGACNGDAGGAWSAAAAPAGDSFQSVWGTSDADVWISGLSSLWHGGAAGWSSVPLPTTPNTAPPFQATAVWTGAPGDLWFAFAGIKEAPAHFTGNAWTNAAAGDNRQVFYLWGSSASDVWGTESGRPGAPGYAGHWDGAAWTLAQGGPGGALWGSSPSDVWCFGISAFHWTGGPQWNLGPALASPKNAVGGSAPNDVWAAGAGSAIHYDGTAWSPEIPLPGSPTIRGIWARCSGDVWAIGDGGAIVHFDGASWSAWPSPTTANLRAVWGSAAGELWAVGDAVLHKAP